MCDYRIVEIERGIGGSFGFSLIGGIDTELPPMVCALVHNGSAQLCGKIQVGDVVLEVNGECVTRLPAKKVVETIKLSPDVLSLRLRKDPEVAARARPYLRKHSVQDPRLQQFQQRGLRRSASLPSRARRPYLGRSISEHIQPSRSARDTFGTARDTDRTVRGTDRNKSWTGKDTDKGDRGRDVGETFRNVRDTSRITRDRNPRGTTRSDRDIFGDVSGSERDTLRNFIETDKYVRDTVSDTDRDVGGTLEDVGDTFGTIRGTASTPTMSKTRHLRIVGGETSPTGIDRGTDGTFRKRVTSRSGSFSKITTSFPAHGGPPCTVENPQRMTGRRLTKTVSESSTSSSVVSAISPSPLVAPALTTPRLPLTQQQASSRHSASLPEINVASLKRDHSSPTTTRQRSSSSQDDVTRDNSSQTSQSIVRSSGNNNSQKTFSPNSSSPLDERTSPHPTPPPAIDASPYPFRKFHNSMGSLPTGGGADQLSPPPTLASAEGDFNGVKNENSDEQNAKEVSSDVARRLFHLEGYQSKDIAPLLSKNNDFSKEIAVHFMKFFDFKNESLVVSLRKLLNKFNLTGETQERERILIPFSNRYHECNNPEYGSEDAVHTLICAIMLLNTDLHGEQTIGRRMKENDFIINLSGLCDDKDFPKVLLKDIYSSIKAKPLEFFKANVQEVQTPVKTNGQVTKVESVGSLALVGYQNADNDVIYKEGLLYRKLIEDAGGKKTSAWKRAWQPFFATLRGMVLFLHKPDESRNFDDTRFSLGVHHSFASPALDYRKKPGVFRFITADWKVMLFQARDRADMLGWVEACNLVAASFSSPPLPAPVGSVKKFQKPVLPFSRTRLSLTQQLASHEKKAQEMENVFIDHLHNQPQTADTRPREVDEWNEKRDFYDYEYKRYRSYANILKSSKLQSQLRERATTPATTDHIKRNGLLSETMKRYSSLNDLLNAVDGEKSPSNTNHRESYFMAIYRG